MCDNRLTKFVSIKDVRNITYFIYALKAIVILKFMENVEARCLEKALEILR